MQRAYLGSKTGKPHTFLCTVMGPVSLCRCAAPEAETAAAVLVACIGDCYMSATLDNFTKPILDAVLVTVLLLRRDTKTKATLIKESI